MMKFEKQINTNFEQKMQPRLRHRFSWTDLPTELLLEIAIKLQCRKTLFHLRPVCRSWRSQIPPPFLQLHPLLPCSIPSQNLDIISDASVLVVSTAVFIFRRFPTDKPWLVAVEQSRNRKFRLFHPLTRAPIPYPCKKVLKMSSVMLSQGFSLRLCDGVTDALSLHKLRRKSYCVNKVIFCRFSECNCVVVLYHTGSLDFFILYRSDEWEIKDGVRNAVVNRRIRGAGMGVDVFVDDVVVWKDKVWAVGRKGKLFGIDCGCKKVEIVANATFVAPGCRRKRLLLDSSDRLCLLLAPDQHCNEFNVYRLNSCFAWEKVETLGDHILFVTFDTCFFVRSQLLPGFKGNCVVFPKNCFPSYFCCPSKYSDDLLFKEQGASGNLQVGVCKYGEGQNFELISAFPVCSAMIWPPPHWFRYLNEERKALVEDQERTLSDACFRNDPKNANAEKVEGTMLKSEVEVIVGKLVAKYGNIVEECAIRNDIKAQTFVLQSLAQVIIILQNNSANTLTEHQVQYLIFTLAHLQRLQLKVDWLVPFVDRAVVRYKSKPWLTALSNSKTLKNEMLESLDGRLKLVFYLLYIDDNQLLADLNKCLGEEIF